MEPKFDPPALTTARVEFGKVDWWYRAIPLEPVKAWEEGVAATDVCTDCSVPVDPCTALQG